MTTITRRRADRAALLALGLGCLATPSHSLELNVPTGARENVSDVTAMGIYELPISGWTVERGVPSARLEGQVTRTAWRLAGTGLTTGQVIGPIRDQLMLSGYEILFECTARSCGGFDFRFNTEVLPAPAMYVDLSDFRFLSARGPDTGTALSLLVSRDRATVFIQVIEVGPPGASAVSLAKAPVAVPFVAGDLVRQLETSGHAVLTDLEFGSGSADLGQGPLESLDELAAYLMSNPSREITFVGHTDATGSLEANVALSRRRAESVRAYLVEKGVPAGQVASDGVGFLSPVASNLTAEGREANRRVEAVLISTQ